MTPNSFLYVALGFYLLGTLAVFGSIVHRSQSLQNAALGLMIAGFASHTVFIGTICARTGHPPLTNLPETTTFIAWVVFAVKLVLHFRYKVRAAAFFVYPLVLGLLGISALVGETVVHLDPSMRSALFTSHLLLTTVGIAALMIGLAFTLLYQLQERSLKSKRRGATWEWIPSLRVCDVVSYRALALGFSIYTAGLLAGMLWAYRVHSAVLTFGVKEAGALVAWVMFAVLLQFHISGTFRTRRTLVVAAVAFLAIFASLFGIRRVGP